MEGAFSTNTGCGSGLFGLRHGLAGTHLSDKPHAAGEPCFGDTCIACKRFIIHHLETINWMLFSDAIGPPPPPPTHITNVCDKVQSLWHLAYQTHQLTSANTQAMLTEIAYLRQKLSRQREETAPENMLKTLATQNALHHMNEGTKPLVAMSNASAMAPYFNARVQQTPATVSNTALSTHDGTPMPRPPRLVESPASSLMVENAVAVLQNANALGLDGIEPGPIPERWQAFFNQLDAMRARRSTSRAIRSSPGFQPSASSGGGSARHPPVAGSVASVVRNSVVQPAAEASANIVRSVSPALASTGLDVSFGATFEETVTQAAFQPLSLIESLTPVARPFTLPIETSVASQATAQAVSATETNFTHSVIDSEVTASTESYFSQPGNAAFQMRTTDEERRAYTTNSPILPPRGRDYLNEMGHYLFSDGSETMSASARNRSPHIEDFAPRSPIFRDPTPPRLRTVQLPSSEDLQGVAPATNWGSEARKRRAYELSSDSEDDDQPHPAATLPGSNKRIRLNDEHATYETAPTERVKKVIPRHQREEYIAVAMESCNPHKASDLPALPPMSPIGTIGALPMSSSIPYCAEGPPGGSGSNTARIASEAARRSTSTATTAGCRPTLTIDTSIIGNDRSDLDVPQNGRNPADKPEEAAPSLIPNDTPPPLTSVAVQDDNEGDIDNEQDGDQPQSPSPAPRVISSTAASTVRQNDTSANVIVRGFANMTHRATGSQSQHNSGRESSRRTLPSRPAIPPLFRNVARSAATPPVASTAPTSSSTPATDPRRPAPPATTTRNGDATRSREVSVEPSRSRPPVSYRTRNSRATTVTSPRTGASPRTRNSPRHDPGFVVYQDPDTPRAPALYQDPSTGQSGPSSSRRNGGLNFRDQAPHESSVGYSDGENDGSVSVNWPY